MSLSTVMFFVACWAWFRVGEFHGRNPGLIATQAVASWRWLCDWLKCGH